MIPRLKELISKEIQPNLKEKLGYKNSDIDILKKKKIL